MGSGVALNLALRHPDRVSALVLARPAWLAAPQPPEKIALYDTIARLLRMHGPEAGRALFADSAELKAIEAASPDSAASLLGQFGRVQAVESIEVLERLPRDAPAHDRNGWRTINVPTLVLANQQDPIHPFSYGETLASEIPDAEFGELTPKSVSRAQHVRDYQRRCPASSTARLDPPKPTRRDGVAGAVLAVDLGGTQIRAALADDEGHLLCREVVATPAEEGAAAVLEAIIAVLQRQAVPGVRHIGISALGPVDPHTGVVAAAPTIPGFTDIPLKRCVEDALGIPTSVVNDTTAAALAEWTLGSGDRRARHFAYVTVSTGIGCGLVVDGDVVTGRHGAAGELGHCIVAPGGPRCTCGGLGHLEGLASGTAIAGQARDAVARGETTVIGEYARDGVITAETVYRAGAHGDRLARTLFETAAQHLGYALTNLVALFDPDVIAIGGGVSLAGDLLWAPLRATLDRELESLAATDVDVVPAMLGGDVGLHGAAIVALQAAGAATNPRRAEIGLPRLLRPAFVW